MRRGRLHRTPPSDQSIDPGPPRCPGHRNEARSTHSVEVSGLAQVADGNDLLVALLLVLGGVIPLEDEDAVIDEILKLFVQRLSSWLALPSLLLVWKHEAADLLLALGSLLARLDLELNEGTVRFLLDVDVDDVGGVGDRVAQLHNRTHHARTVFGQRRHEANRLDNSISVFLVGLHS